MGKVKKNNYIEFLRFIFCIIILFHHSGFVSKTGNGIFPSGGVLADTFFMLTGYFACAHLERKDISVESPLRYSIKYTLSKIKRVLPYTTFGILIIYIHEFLHINDLTLGVIVNKLYHMAVELLLLPTTGIIKLDLITLRNAPLWYLSALLLALPVVMFIAIKWNWIFKNIIVWVVPLCIQMWFVIRFGGALPWLDFVGFVNSGVIRGFSGIIMGFGIYYASSFIKNLLCDGKGIRGGQMDIAKKYLSRQKAEVGRGTKIMLTIVELSLLVTALFSTYNGVRSYGEVVTIYILYIMLTISLSGMSYTSDMKIKAFSYLGKLSLPIYCIHWGIYRLAAGYLTRFDYAVAVSIVLIVCVLTSAILVALEERYVAGKKL